MSVHRRQSALLTAQHQRDLSLTSLNCDCALTSARLRLRRQRRSVRRQSDGRNSVHMYHINSIGSPMRLSGIGSA